MTNLLPILISLAVTGLAPVAVFLTGSWIERGKRRRAFARIVREPAYHVGAEIVELRAPNYTTTMMKDCKISQIEEGRVEVTDASGRVMIFSGQEFETLHPVFAKDYA